MAGRPSIARTGFLSLKGGLSTDVAFSFLREQNDGVNGPLGFYANNTEGPNPGTYQIGAVANGTIVYSLSSVQAQFSVPLTLNDATNTYLERVRSPAGVDANWVHSANGVYSFYISLTGISTWKNTSTTNQVTQTGLPDVGIISYSNGIRVGTTSDTTAGNIRFNSGSNVFEGYDGTGWVTFSAGITSVTNTGGFYGAGATVTLQAVADQLGPLAGNKAQQSLLASANVIDQVTAATYPDATWEVVMRKGTAINKFKVSAITNGTDVAFTRFGETLLPANATFDYTINVLLTGANLQLVITPATTGWYASFTRSTITAASS